MKYTREMARQEYNSLPENLKIAVYNQAIDYYNFVRANQHLPEDPMYLFWSLNKEMFDDDDITDFMEINTKEEFESACVYHMSRFYKRQLNEYHQ